MSSRLAAYGLAATVFLVDRVSKAFIDARVSLWDTYVVVPGLFNIVHTENRGAAFGMFADAETGWRTFFLLGLSLLVLALAAVALWHPYRSTPGGRWFRPGLALVLGGALGNIYDRLTHGSVTDFLDFFIAGHHWPAFNVADSAITVGAAFLLADMWLSRRRTVAT